MSPRRTRLRVVSIATVIAALALFASCDAREVLGRSGSVDVYSGYVERVEVGSSEEATAVHEVNGIAIEIPPGAIEDDTVISVERITEDALPVAPEESLARAGDLFVVEVEGGLPAAPIEISLPYGEVETPGELVVVHFHDGGYDTIAGVAADGVVRIALADFSPLGVYNDTSGHVTRPTAGIETNTVFTMDSVPAGATTYDENAWFFARDSWEPTADPTDSGRGSVLAAAGARNGSPSPSPDAYSPGMDAGFEFAYSNDDPTVQSFVIEFDLYVNAPDESSASFRRDSFSFQVRSTRTTWWTTVTPEEGDWAFIWDTDGWIHVTYDLSDLATLLTSLAGASIWGNEEYPLLYLRGLFHSDHDVDTSEAPSGAYIDDLSVSVSSGLTVKDVSAGDGTLRDRVRITWDYLEGAARYYVYRQESDAAEFVELGYTTRLYYEDTSIAPNELYRYAVRAWASGSLQGPLSEPDVGYALASVASVRATQGAHPDRVEIDWDEIAGATSYTVHRAASPDGTYQQIASTESLSATDRDVADRAVYTYVVRPVSDATGEGAASDPVLGYRQTAAPGAATATDGEEPAVTVTWTDDRDDVIWYLNRADAEQGEYTSIGQSRTRSFVDDTAEGGVAYWYRVEAWHPATGLSSLGPADSGYIPDQGLLPTSLTATSGEHPLFVRLSWNAAATGGEYLVYRSDASDGTLTHVATTSAVTYDDTPPTTMDPYVYAVRYRSPENRYGPFSTTAQGFAGTATLEAPTATLASDGAASSGIEITFDAVYGAATYAIERAPDGSDAFTEIAAAAPSGYEDTTAAPGSVYRYRVRASSPSAGWGPYGAVDTGYRLLSPPPSVSAEDGQSATTVEVTWGESPGAETYHVYRATSASGTYTELTETSQRSHTDEPPNEMQTYYYTVTADSPLTGESVRSNPDGGFRGTATLGIPSNVSATDGTVALGVTITWSSVYGASSYTVYRATSAGGTYAEVGVAGGTSFTDTSAGPGSFNNAIYYYKVRAASASAGYGEYSDYDSGHEGLPAPANLSAADGSNENYVYVNWDGVFNASGYDVYRSTSRDGTYSRIGSSASTDSSYRDTSASAGTYYYYKVRAKASFPTYEESGFSNIDWGSVAVPIEAPTGLSASDGTSYNWVSISWNPVENAASYDLYRATTSGGSYSKIDTVTSTDVVDPTATPGVTYYYKVRAVGTDSSDVSDFSGYASGYRKKLIVATPTGLQASDGTYPDRIVVTWNAVSDADGYQVAGYAEHAGGGTEYFGPFSVSGTSYTDSSLSMDPGDNYYYQVRAHFPTDEYSSWTTFDLGYVQ